MDLKLGLKLGLELGFNPPGYVNAPSAHRCGSGKPKPLLHAFALPLRHPLPLVFVGQSSPNPASVALTCCNVGCWPALPRFTTCGDQ
jgi:hypothetical protein